MNLLLSSFDAAVELALQSQTEEIFHEALEQIKAEDRRLEAKASSLLLSMENGLDGKLRIYAKFLAYKRAQAKYASNKIMMSRISRDDIYSHNWRRSHWAYHSEEAKVNKTEMLRVLCNLQDLFPTLTYKEINRTSLPKLVGTYVGLILDLSWEVSTNTFFNLNEYIRHINDVLRNMENTKFTAVPYVNEPVGWPSTAH